MAGLKTVLSVSIIEVIATAQIRLRRYEPGEWTGQSDARTCTERATDGGSWARNKSDVLRRSDDSGVTRTGTFTTTEAKHLPWLHPFGRPLHCDYLEGTIALHAQLIGWLAPQELLCSIPPGAKAAL
jgi:hypothetical protein